MGINRNSGFGQQRIDDSWYSYPSPLLPASPGLAYFLCYYFHHSQNELLMVLDFVQRFVMWSENPDIHSLKTKSSLEWSYELLWLNSCLPNWHSLPLSVLFSFSLLIYSSFMTLLAFGLYQMSFSVFITYLSLWYIFMYDLSPSFFSAICITSYSKFALD